MADIIVKNHIYDFMRSPNIATSQQSINVPDKSELNTLKIDVDILKDNYDVNSINWDSTYTIVQSNSSSWVGGLSDTIVISNSANWDKTYTTVSANSAKWNPVHINVKNYGAKGDGITNDYANIRTAFDQLTANGGGVIYFPKGNYFINSAIEIKNSSIPITIIGDGESTTITAMSGLSSTNTGKSPIIFGYYSSNISIKNLKLDGQGSIQPVPLSGGLPLYYNRAKHQCFLFQYCKNIDFDNVSILNSQQSSEFGICSSVNINNCIFKNSTYRFPLTGTLGRFIGLYYPDLPTLEIYAAGSGLLGFNTSLDVVIDKCYFEGWQYDAVGHVVYDTPISKNFEIHNSTFYNISGGAFAIECFHANTHPLTGQMLENQKYTNNTFINSVHNPFDAGTGISNGVKGVIISNNIWLDYSLGGYDSWRKGLELNGSDMVISDNIFNNAQVHLNTSIRPYVIENTINANYNVTGNIFNSNLSTTGGNGTIFVSNYTLSGDNLNISDNIFTYLSGMGYRSINISNVSNIIVDNNIFKKPVTPETDDLGIAIQMANIDKVKITNNNIENFSVGINLPASNSFKSRNIYIKDNFLKNSGPGYIGNQNIQFTSNNGIGVNNSIIDYKIYSLSTLSLSSYFPINNNEIFVRNSGGFPRSKFIILNISNPIELDQNLILNNINYKLSSFDILYNASSNFGIGEELTATKFYQYNEDSFVGDNCLNYNLSTRNILMSENYSEYNVGMISEMVLINTTPYSDSSKILLPENSIIKSVVANVSMPPDGVTSFDIGTSTSNSRFSNGLTNNRSDKKIGFNHIPNNTVQLTNDKIRITPNTTPLSAGLINVSVFFEKFVAPQD